MVEIRRILCPSDFSDSSRHALEHAMVMARWYGSQVVALHVGNPMILLGTVAPVPSLVGESSPDDTNRRRLEEDVRTWLSPAIAAGLAQESNARLALLHVFEWPSDEASARRVLETSEFHRQWEMDTRHQLGALIPDEARNWRTPEPMLACRKTYQRILRVAASEHADLIVMGVRGR